MLPTLTVQGDNIGGVADSFTLKMTADGIAQFPALTDADFSNAQPWHAYFTGGFDALPVLATGNGDNAPNGASRFDDAVALGGGFSGGGGVIIPVPEPESLALALVGLAVSRPKRIASVAARNQQYAGVGPGLLSAVVTRRLARTAL